MKFWFLVMGGWLLFSGLVFAGLAFALGMPILPSLAASFAVTTLLLWFWSRDVEAEPLSLNESLWNTPEDDDEDVDASAR